MVQENNQKYANKIGYSDVEPFEVVGTITEKTLDIRQMDARNIKPATMVAPGGFVGHFDNSTQEWEITSNVGFQIVRIRQNKKGEWKDKNGNLYQIGDKPRKVYDYNF